MRIGLVLMGLLVMAVGPAAAQPAATTPEATKPAAQVVRSGTWSMTLPLGLPADSAYIPDDNPMSDEKIALGKLLYFDERLSKDNTLSCASCHMPFHGFADPNRTSPGVGRQFGARNSPTVMNRLFSREQFWDGRAKDLEEQAHGPLTNPVEMAMGSHDEVVARVKAVQGYGPLFARAYGDPGIDMPRIARAIAAYERTVVTGDSPYDRYLAGDKSALSESQLRGLGAFFGRGRCVTCHVGFNFTDESYRNLGVGMDKPQPDLGRYVVTKREEDKGAFKTPTLRNIVLTAPYMHDGSEGTLEAVVELYDRGGVRNPWLSKDMQPLGLSPQEKRDLVAFMEALTGPIANAEPPAALPQ
ncbi:MAG TPA: cytochrome c peroxidase [Candidatus Dormibacteraeota bacterium]|nr:cytochrome c peroxidase [Candidatus Dormibacteraeota bacterium]